MTNSVVVKELPAVEPEGEERALVVASTSHSPVNQEEDWHLADRVKCALTATGYMPLSGASVTAQSGWVLLEGRAPSFYLKQIAQAAAAAVPGVSRIHNNLRVIPQR